MALSNTAVPKYYGQFRDAVMRGEIPICEEVNLEMHRIDDLIANPGIWYDNQAVEGFIHYCENELTLTDGEDLHLLDSFKLWAEEIFGWYYFVERSIYDPEEGRYIKKTIKKRLINKQYLIVARGAAKSMYAACIQSYFLNVDTTTTHQVTTAPTMKQSEEVLSPIRTAITRARGPLFQFLTEGSLQNTTGSRANRQKLASTKKGIENFLTGSLLEIRPMSIDKLQGLNSRINTVDEWLSGDVREDVIGALEQGASKNDDYLIVAISSEGKKSQKANTVVYTRYLKRQAKADKLQAKANKKKYGLFTNAKKAAELQVKADRAQYKADKIKGRAEKRNFKESKAKGRYVRAQRKAERWVKQMDKTFQSYDVSKLSAQNVAAGEAYIKKIA